MLLAIASVKPGHDIVISENATIFDIQQSILDLVTTVLSRFTSIQVCDYLRAIFINAGGLGTYLSWNTRLNFSHVLIGAVLVFCAF